LAQNGVLHGARGLLDTVDIKMQTMLGTLMDYMPITEDKTISEMTFIMNHIAPILHGVLKFDPRMAVHFPNTDCGIQKQQGVKPDRPDISIKISGQEVLFGEVSGPHQQTNESKNKWDLFRLMRSGKAFLDAGNRIAPLIQAIYSNGKYMRLVVKTRGMHLLEEVGSFAIPTTIITISSLISSLSVLLSAK
ncbi:hypothetical protein BGZ79_001854, partial [Entomortierella chlamydospora]